MYRFIIFAFVILVGSYVLAVPLAFISELIREAVGNPEGFNASWKRQSSFVAGGAFYWYLFCGDR